MATVEAHVVKWLKLEVANLGEAGTLAKLELYHVVEGEGADRLQIFTPEEGEDVDMLAQKIWDVAEHDTTTRANGMPQHYAIWAYRGESPEPSSQHRLVLRGKGIGTFNSGEGSEPATDRGERGQQMRQLENQHRIIMNMATEFHTRFAADLQKERERSERSETRMMELLDTHQALLNQDHQRRLEQAKEESKERRMDMMSDFLMTMAPLLMAKFLGGEKGITGLATSARDSAIGNFLKGLSPEEAMSVMGAVNGNNKIALIELYKSYQEDDSKKQDEKPTIFQDKERRLLQAVK